MGCTFIEGWDHMTAVQGNGRSWTYGGGSSVPTVGATGRFGGNRLNLNYSAGGGGSTALFVQRVLPTSRAKYGCSFAVMFTHTAYAMDCEVMGLYEGATQHIAVRWNTNVLYLVRGGTTIATGIKTILLNVWYHVELWVEVSDTVGVAKVWIDGNPVPEMNFSGDTRNGGTGVINTALMRSGSGSNAGTINLYDDMVFYDDQSADYNVGPIGDCRVESLVPSGAGTTGNGTPSAGSSYQCVDEKPPNDDTDYVSFAAASDKDTYAMGDLASTTGDVVCVQVEIRPRRTDVGARAFKSVIRESGGTEQDGTEVYQTTTYLHQIDVRPYTPSSALWDIAAVNAMQVGAKMSA